MIHFHTEETSFTLKNKNILKKWISSIVKKNKREIKELNFIFCSDEFLLKMNKQYLQHDTYTDIITFDYSLDDKRQAISGDIFISIERVQENAEKFSKSFEQELHRVIIHGTLHLLGYKDKTKAAKAEMTRQEELCLKELGSFDKLRMTKKINKE